MSRKVVLGCTFNPQLPLHDLAATLHSSHRRVSLGTFDDCASEEANQVCELRVHDDVYAPLDSLSRVAR
jgi:hypothetical protein